MLLADWSTNAEARILWSLGCLYLNGWMQPPPSGGGPRKHLASHLPFALSAETQAGIEVFAQSHWGLLACFLLPYHTRPNGWLCYNPNQGGLRGQATFTGATCPSVMTIGHLAISSVFSKSFMISSFMRKIWSSWVLSPHKWLWLSMNRLKGFYNRLGVWSEGRGVFFPNH